MELIKLEISKVEAKVVSRIPIPANMVGGKIRFAYGPEWEGLIKTVVLKGCKTVYIPDAENVVEIPQEVVAAPGGRLLVGVCGVDAQETLVIPTLWADLGWVRGSASLDGEPGSDPTLPVWAQLERRMKALEGNVTAGEEPEWWDIPKVFLEGEIPTTKEDVLAQIQYVSQTDTFHAYVKIKCQGTSSMNYDKKNFTVKLYADEERVTPMPMRFRDWDVLADKFCLKANYIDHTHARNIICANLWDQVVSSRDDYASLPVELRMSPRNGAVDGFPIKVYTNGTYQGLYTWNIPKDAWTWNMDEENKNHILLCAETNTDGVFSENACNFRALWSGTDGEDWSVEVGENSEAVKTSLNSLITCVMDTDDETFKETIGNYLDVQSAIDYYLHQYVICGIDGLAKNMLLATYDGTKWFCGAYDMDSTLGLTPQGATGAVLATQACPEEYQEQFSLLWQRMVNAYHEDMKTRYAQLRKTVYSYANMVSLFERFMDKIGQELYQEDTTLYPIPSSDTNNLLYLRNFVRDRLAYMDAMVPKLAQTIACTGIALDQTQLVFGAGALEDQQLTAAVTPEDTTDSVIWTSSDSEVATVVMGLVSPKNVGECIITVQCGVHSAQCQVTVSQAGLDSQILWTDGYYVSGSTGETASSSADCASDFVNLYGATKLLFDSESFRTGGKSGRVHYYDADKTQISYVNAYSNNCEMDVDVPEGAVYARFSEFTAYRDTFAVMTDVDTNGFVKLDTDGFVENQIPSESGIVSGSNVGYYNQVIPVEQGQHLVLVNAYPLFKGEEENCYKDAFLVMLDAEGSYVSKTVMTDYCMFGTAIPEGVAGVYLSLHNTCKNYGYYKIL